jgi:hypothetical protein
MIGWFTAAQVVVAVAGGLVCLVLGFARRKPNDLTLFALAAVEALLVAQTVIAIVAPFVGNSPTGNPWEFWIYLVSALLIPPLAVAWALIDRTRWSTVVLGVAALAIAVMVWRMNEIWFVQML